MMQFVTALDWFITRHPGFSIAGVLILFRLAASVGRIGTRLVIGERGE